jgi:hypothetical protein
MTISGEKAPAFSFRSLVMPETQQDNSDAIIKISHEKYSIPRNEVEDIIIKANELENKPNKEQPKPTQRTTKPHIAPLVGVQLAPNTNIDNSNQTVKKKRKRTRSRRKKNDNVSGQAMDTIIIKPTKISEDEGTTIHLR